MDKYLLDGHKLYWHLDRVLEYQERGIISPIYMEISPVAYCDHKCIFCGIDFVRNMRTYLNTDILCKRLEEMGRLGVRSIMFAGEGEPLLHKDLSLFVKTACENGIDVSITTNGATGNYKKWLDILPYLVWIRFSVDAATPEVYSKVHNVYEKIFEKAIRSIEEAVKVKKELSLKTTIGVQFIVLEENIDDLEKALDLFSHIGVDYFSIKPYSLHPQMINKKDVVYDHRIIDHICGVINRFDKNNMKVIFRKESTERYALNERSFTRCHALPFWGYVSSTGDFYTCSVFINDKRFLAGNIYNENMEEIFFGYKRQASILFGKEKIDISECRLNCRMARINEFLEVLVKKPEHVNFI